MVIELYAHSGLKKTKQFRAFRFTEADEEMMAKAWTREFWKRGEILHAKVFMEKGWQKMHREYLEALIAPSTEMPEAPAGDAPTATTAGDAPKFGEVVTPAPVVP